MEGIEGKRGKGGKTWKMWKDGKGGKDGKLWNNLASIGLTKTRVDESGMIRLTNAVQWAQRMWYDCEKENILFIFLRFVGAKIRDGERERNVDSKY